MENRPQTEARVLDAQFWSDLGMKYEEAYGDDEGLVKMVQKWLSYLPPASTVLECGCGTGKPIARTIADAGYHYHGIDLASGMVALCQKQVPEGTYQVVNMVEYVPSILYDGVVASFSHFELTPEQHQKMAHNWMQWIRPGGFLFLSTITGGVEHGEPKSWDPEAGHAKSWDPESGCATGVDTTFMGNRILVTVYTQEGWKKLLQDAGFELVHIETDYFQPKEDVSPGEPRYYVIAKRP